MFLLGRERINHANTAPGEGDLYTLGDLLTLGSTLVASSGFWCPRPQKEKKKKETHVRRGLSPLCMKPFIYQYQTWGQILITIFVHVVFKYF